MHRSGGQNHVGRRGGRHQVLRPAVCLGMSLKFTPTAEGLDEEGPQATRRRELPPGATGLVTHPRHRQSAGRFFLAAGPALQ